MTTIGIAVLDPSAPRVTDRLDRTGCLPVHLLTVALASCRLRCYGDGAHGAGDIDGVARRACRKRWGQGAWRYGQTPETIIPPRSCPIHGHYIGVLTPIHSRYDDRNECARSRSVKRNGPGLVRRGCLPINRHACIGMKGGLHRDIGDATVDVHEIVQRVRIKRGGRVTGTQLHSGDCYCPRVPPRFTVTR